MSAFQPNYAVSPGATLQETIDELGMTQAELARRMDQPKKTINEIINGKAAITAEIAFQLEKVTGVPGQFWIQSEALYRETLVRIAEREKLATFMHSQES